MQWQRFDRLEDMDASLLAATSSFVAAHPQANIEHDLRWLSARAQFADRALRIYIARDASLAIRGVAPFFIHPSTLAIDFLGKSLISLRTKRATLNAGPLLSPPDHPDEALLHALLQQIGRDLSGAQSAYILGCPAESAAAQQLLSPALSSLRAIAISAPYARRAAAVSPTLEDYLAMLGTNARQDLKRNERKLLKHVNDEVRCEIFSTKASVENFLTQASAISKATYQTKVFGVGVSNDDHTAALLKSAAEQNRLRCYVLYCGDVATAFMLGYLHAGIYYSEAIGYLPDWKEWGVGNTLHLHVMKDLSALGTVERFDFMYGDNPNKARLATESVMEQNIIIFAKHGSARWVGAAYQASLTFSAWASKILDRAGVKDKLRKMLRASAA